MPIGTTSRRLTASYVVVCVPSCADSNTDQDKDDASAITPHGRMLSSLILGCSRCTRPISRRANPDEETTDWRARRGRTAHRVRREGTAITVPYPYRPSTVCDDTISKESWLIPYWASGFAHVLLLVSAPVPPGSIAPLRSN